MGGCTQTAFDILKPSKRNKTAVIHRLCRKAGFKGLELQERVLLMCSSGKYRYQHTHPKEGYGNLRWKGGGGGGCLLKNKIPVSIKLNGNFQGV